MLSFRNYLLLLLISCISAFAPAVHAASSCGYIDTGLVDSRSAAAQLSSDVSVGATPVVLASTTVSFCETHPIFLHAAGNWFYQSGAPLGEMRIRVDGNYLPNLTAMYFGVSGQRHPFSVAAAIDLAAGSHTVELVAMRTLGSGSFVVQASAQIAALVGFGAVTQSVLSNDVFVDQSNPLLVSAMNFSTGGAGVYLNQTGTAQRVVDSGDALTQITLDGQVISTLGINDMVQNHEEIAPINSIAVSLPSNGSHQWGLVSNRFVVPGTYNNTVKFNLLHGSSLVAAYGGNTGYAISVGNETLVDLSADRRIDDVTFTLPYGHNGNVWISTQGRWLDLNGAGIGGLVASVIELDGVQVGPWAVQYFENGYTQSQRNFSMGYLVKSLSPGSHTVRLVVKKAIAGDPYTNMPYFNVTPKTVVLW